MSTLITWTDETWNPITGCTPASPGCIYCYARVAAERMKHNPNPKVAHLYRNGFGVTTHPEALNKPRHWGKPRMIFVNSMGDTFHRDVPDEFIRELFQIMRECSRHIFQVLTKRPERMVELAPSLSWPANVWAGVTVESADYLPRITLLRTVPARVRFVSFEPLLGPIPGVDFTGIHQAIVGGESGPRARPMALDWARDLRDQSVAAGVSFFFKQVGGRGKDKGGKVLDGREWHEIPR